MVAVHAGIKYADDHANTGVTSAFGLGRVDQGQVCIVGGLHVRWRRRTTVATTSATTSATSTTATSTTSTSTTTATTATTATANNQGWNLLGVATAAAG